MLRSAGIPCVSLGDSNAWIEGLADDHRRVKPGFLFVARIGSVADGAAFASDAESRGAVAIVSDRPLPGARVPVAIVPDAADALRAVADAFHDRPTDTIRLVGITGTNGKTTTAYLVQSILEAQGCPAGLIGTVTYRVGKEEHPSEATTPGILRLREIFSLMRDAGCRSCAMELSSHGLAQGRHRGLPLSAGVFTNLAQDHLDYHKTIDDYRRAKRILFESLASTSAAVLNARDPVSEEYARSTRARVVRFGLGIPADVTGRILEEGVSGMVVGAVDCEGEARLESPLVGRYNAENLLAAAAAARAIGISWRAIEAGVRAVACVPGRLEPVDEGQPFRVLVDYAHTEDGIRKVLEALRPITQGRLRILFGCGGDRDRTKRPRMGRAAAEGADEVFLTSDNPRSEDPDAILDEVLAGGPFAVPFRRIPDRRIAIRAAVRAARPGDTLILAGKGHERVQIVGNASLPFDDREEARAALREALGSCAAARGAA
ncbi:MAG: UDP-N-acetylmuramoyl-L-alanyl-D-glutamate--2,6-diaminopimelate ligase [Planctomycetota bacterium]